MTRLDKDTQVTTLDVSEDAGHFQGELHPDWQVWFPNGGYMGAMMLRAGCEFSSFDRPLSFSCHFLSVPKIGDVSIHVVSLRKTRFAESLSIEMKQGKKPIIQALMWVGMPVDGYAHDDAVMPSVPPVDQCKPTTEIEGGHASHPFWNMLEQRPTTGDLHWQIETSSKAVQRDWIRFSCDAPVQKMHMDMARYIVLLDTYAWPAAARAHAGDGRFIAPTLSLNVEFHRHYDGRWMLSDASAPIAADGYISAQNRLWSEGGQLIGSAVATLMCRPRPEG